MLLVKDRIRNADTLLSRIREHLLDAAEKSRPTSMDVNEVDGETVLTVRIQPHGASESSPSWQKLYAAIPEVKAIIDLLPQTQQVKIILDFRDKGVRDVRLETAGPTGSR